MDQEATKSFGVYSELVIMNEMCIGESYSLPSLIAVITYR